MIAREPGPDNCPGPERAVSIASAKRPFGRELFDPVIAVIRNVNRARGIDGYPGRIRELTVTFSGASDRRKLVPGRIELLDVVVVIVAYGDISFRVGRNRVRMQELAGWRSQPSRTGGRAQVLTPSAPDSDTDGFNTQYGPAAPGAKRIARARSRRPVPAIAARRHPERVARA